MNLVSRLAAAVFASSNHINFDIAKPSDTVLSQKIIRYDFSVRHTTQKQLVIFLNNSSVTEVEYSFSKQPSQPFDRSRLRFWRRRKHRN